MQPLSEFSRRGFMIGMAGLGLIKTGAGQVRHDYPAAPVPLEDVRVTDAFWLPRIEKARTVSLPMLLERGGRI